MHAVWCSHASGFQIRLWCLQVQESVQLVESDLTHGLPEEVQGAIDILVSVTHSHSHTHTHTTTPSLIFFTFLRCTPVFNPDYMPTPNEEVDRPGAPVQWCTLHTHCIHMHTHTHTCTHTHPRARCSTRRTCQHRMKKSSGRGWPPHGQGACGDGA